MVRRAYKGPDIGLKISEVDRLTIHVKKLQEDYEELLRAYNAKCAQYTHLINEAGKL